MTLLQANQNPNCLLPQNQNKRLLSSCKFKFMINSIQIADCHVIKKRPRHRAIKVREGRSGKNKSARKNKQKRFDKMVTGFARQKYTRMLLSNFRYMWVAVVSRFAPATIIGLTQNKRNGVNAWLGIAILENLRWILQVSANAEFLD